ncbi:MAG: cellulose synthase subunit BcsC-related outer membrane protein [Sulfurovum sp.]|nr:cellulose synthase subunit BcsC-related outer membrane protein [Sulfurovum sp.]
MAKELYKKHQDDKYLKLLVRDYLRIKSIDKAQFYYTLLKDKRGIENPKEVQRVLLANRYLKEKNLKEAARAIKKISNQKLKAKFSTRLDILRKNSAKDRLLNYSRAKEYKKCSAFATKLIRSYGDKDIDRIGGWCAFNAKQYKEAEVFFERIVEKDAEDADLYALALNAEKSHNNTKAIESLERIKNPYQKPEQILSLYVDLDQTRNAKELLQEMKDSQERDSLIRKVNKSNKKESHIHQVVGGFSYYRNKGEKGENYLELTSMPLDIGYLSQDGRYYWYGEIDFLHISNGHTVSSDGIEATFGFKSDDFHIEMGFTPLGMEVSPALTAKFYTHYSWNQWDIHGAVEQQSIKESSLSYIGQKVSYAGERYRWGRILKRGATLGISYDGDATYSLDLFYYPKIFGENIIENSEKKVSASAIYHTTTDYFAFMDWGMVLIYDAFEKNSNFFTYGYGGYFSPEKFLLATAVVDIGDYISEDT